MAAERVTDQAFVTLATTDAYAFGAMVLGRSLRRVGTTRQLVVMVSRGVTQPIRQQLSSIFDEVTQVDVLDSRDSMNLDLLTRPDLGVTFTKLHCWRLTQYSKGVFLDADTMVLQNIDDLFDREELSAAPDAGWPDCFNSGVFVFCPSQETYQSLLQFALQHGSFDGGDQGLLNAYFNDWSHKDIKKHLPFIYNCVSQAFYSYLPAFKQFGSTIKVVHFIGALKPWHHSYNTGTRSVETQGDVGHHKAYLQLWWDIFMADIKENVSPDLVGVAGHLAKLRLDSGPSNRGSYTEAELADSDRQYSWEMGRIDYLGIDAFSNIQKRLDEVLSQPPPAPKSTDPVQPPVLQPPVVQPAAKPKTTTPTASKAAPTRKPQGILKKH